MRWFAWAVGQLLGPRQLTMEQVRNGEHVKWGWRGTDIIDDDGKLIAHTPGANKPGHVGVFPLDEADEELLEDSLHWLTEESGDWLE